MYVYIYIHIYLYTYIHIHTHICVCIYIYKQIGWNHKTQQSSRGFFLLRNEVTGGVGPRKALELAGGLGPADPSCQDEGQTFQECWELIWIHAGFHGICSGFISI